MEGFIKGNFRKCIYKGKDNYIVGLFKVKDASLEFEKFIGNVITFTGYFPPLNEYDEYKFFGYLKVHAKYGEQYTVIKYDVILPSTEHGIIAFLSSNIFKGIGEKKASKVVKALGDDALHLILENPSNLNLIQGINVKDIAVISTKLKEYASTYTDIIKLVNQGFTSQDALLIIKIYQNKTSSIIDDDIYKLTSDIKDLSFPKIDFIALRQGMEKDDDRRVRSGIIYVINTLTEVTGNCFFQKEEIINYLYRVFGFSLKDEKIDNAFQNLILTGRIINIKNRYYIRDMYDAECYITRRIVELNDMEDDVIINLERYLKEFEEANNTVYNDEQKKAIRKALTKHICIITGGPGTGKTTILKAIVGLLKDIYQNDMKLDNDLVLLAPTGRASKRMAEASNFKASTIHRFLKWNKDTDKFGINEYNKSDAKIIIMDEASMLDIYLFHNLLKGLKEDTKIILVGDYHQLPSVGPGQVLKDMIESDVVDVSYLKELYRQGKDSNIISLAYGIKNSDIDKEIFNVADDLTYLSTSSSTIIDTLKEVCEIYEDVDYKNFQVLVPMYKGVNGIDRLNVILQEIFNKKDETKKEIFVGDIIFREQDKVIQLVNLPDDNVFNGDIGIIEKIDNGDNKAIYINFDGNVIKCPPSLFSSFKHGYAVSIHKAQGSEFDIVILPMSLSYGKMLYQKLVYTAVTRCKKHLYIIGDMNALVEASLNTNSENRRSSLKELLINKYN